MNLLAALGFAVFERKPHGTFELSGPAPVWLPGGDPIEAFPFLPVFLPDAEELWENPAGRVTLYSDFWTQPDSNGDDLHLCAIAIAGDRNFLLIECAEQRFGEIRSAVQYAHEAALARDQIAKLNGQVERATQAKSEFVARMSHEIRTPLNALLGIGELLSDTPLNDQQSEYVRVFRAAGDNLLEVINDILDFSKVEAGRVELENVAFDLPGLVAGAVELSAVRAKARGIEMTGSVQPDVARYVLGDPGRLRQILLNLLGNAVKFTERGSIALLVEDLGDALHFSVSDTGIGIPADRLPSIFDSFSQGGASTARHYGGTGLGLAISKRFVELMGGRIWVESTVGAGTTFHFTARFAVAEEATVPAGEPRPDGAPASSSKSGLRVLIADDGAENRFLIRSYLQDVTSRVDEADNGAWAVEKFAENTYDLVLLDSDMPELDGYAATEKMRAIERGRGSGPTPIFSLTAHIWKQAEDRSRVAGCTAHLTKPLRRATLFDAITKFVPSVSAEARRTVAVEPWLKPVVGRYIENRRADVGRLRAALDSGDYPTVRLLGHQMAGTGGGYGFDAISDIGCAIEESALARDVNGMRKAIDDLERFLLGIHVD
jgi:signal transduction histidine kinase/CheY-like chemotaxis protein